MYSYTFLSNPQLHSTKPPNKIVPEVNLSGSLWRSVPIFHPSGMQIIMQFDWIKLGCRMTKALDPYQKDCKHGRCHNFEERLQESFSPACCFSNSALLSRSAVCCLHSSSPARGKESGLYEVRDEAQCSGVKGFFGEKKRWKKKKKNTHTHSC